MARWFAPAELRCRCGKCGLGLAQMDPDLVERLDHLRDLVGGPLAITSAVRCAGHNAAVGGSPTSSHLTGNAVDIAVPGVAQRYSLLSAALSQGFKRVGIGRDFIHLDNDSGKPGGVVWLY